ncbi:MAG: hypothetical protein R3C14_40175 [Caldilineaceae bacterium]
MDEIKHLLTFIFLLVAMASTFLPASLHAEKQGEPLPVATQSGGVRPK